MTARHAHRLLLTSAFLLGFVTCGANAFDATSPGEVGLSAERLERLDAALESYVEDGRLAGSVVLVARRGDIAHLRAFGERDRESNSPMREDAIFRIASQTKAIVSTAVLMLQERGELLIGDPVGRYLPEFTETTVAVPKPDGGYDVVEASRPVTIRDLLTHTSGFGYGTGVAADAWADAGIQGWYFADRDEPIGDTISRLAGLPADAQPGESWIYGYNTDILGALVERVSGQPLDRFLADNIFEPLGMSDTHFYLPRAKRDRLASVYSSAEGGIERAEGTGSIGQGAYVDGPRESFSGGAGLLSTVTDYARFLQMLLNGGELDGERLLSPKTVELMTTSHLGDDVEFRPGEGFGLGFYVVEDVGARGVPGSVGEYGWGGAYHSTYWVDPEEELIVVYMSQLIPATDIDDQAKLRALVYQAIVD
ncbi:MAG: beta-lactamase family protein [Gammaproteobacteria bacterium]|nr:beta-lactamase family protein [Gammaproteobacteria bacterium]